MSALLYKSYISLNLLCYICVLTLQCRDFSCSILLRFLLRKPEQIRVEEPGVASRTPGDSRIRDDFITPKYGWVLTKQLLQNLHNHLNNKLQNIQLEQEQNRIEPICSYSNEVFYFLVLLKVRAVSGQTRSLKPLSDCSAAEQTASRTRARCCARGIRCRVASFYNRQV